VIYFIKLPQLTIDYMNLIKMTIVNICKIQDALQNRLAIAVNQQRLVSQLVMLGVGLHQTMNYKYGYFNLSIQDRK